MNDPSSPPPRSSWRSILRTAFAVVLFFAVFVVLPLRGERWWLGVAMGILLLAAMGPLAVRRTYRVLSSDRPLVEAFSALVELLGLMIFGFAAAYYAMNSSGTEVAGLHTRVDSVYFTVTTLSTVGFGDLTASTQAARVVVTIQIVFDLLFLGIAFRVLGTAARRRVEEKMAHE
jgi:voltage-gated potassium channel